MNRSFPIYGLCARAHETNLPGICLLRFRDPISKAGIERVGHALTPLGVAEVSETLAGATGALQIYPFSWIPGPAEEVDQQRATLERVAANEHIEAAWFFQPLGPSTGTTTVDLPFSVEGHTEAVEEFDWYDFGLAIKLAPPRLAGEELVLRAFHWFWVKPLLGAFRNSDVTVDRVHRAAHFWVDRFKVSGDYAVSSVLQVAKALNEVLPIAHATFHTAAMTQKYGRLMKGDNDGDEGEPFILAGNPLGAEYFRGGMSAAAQWQTQQTLWACDEVAHMLRETAASIVNSQQGECEEELDPQRADSALALLDEAWRKLPADEEIQLALGQVLVHADRHHQLLGYLPSFGIVACIHLAILLGESESPQFQPAFELLLGEPLPTRIVGENVSACAAASISSLGDQSSELLERLTSSAITLAPALLPAWLARLPGRIDLLFPIAIALKRENLFDLAADVYARILALPPPLPNTRMREQYCRAHNNAIVLACENGHFDIAVKISNASQRYGFENPWIYHSAACAYACAGLLDQAYEQVALAIDHDYPYLAPDTGIRSSHYLESDRDLGALRDQPRFTDLFARWRRARKPLMEGLQALAEESPQRAVPLLQEAAADSSPLARKAAGALAKTYLALGDAEAAWAVAFPAFERFPEDPELLAHLAAAGRRLGRLHEMIPLLEREAFPASHQSIEIGRSVLKDCGKAHRADTLMRRWGTSKGG